MTVSGPLALPQNRKKIKAKIAVVLFPQLTALDAVGPYEALQRLPEATVIFTGHRRGEIRSENGFLGLTADATFDEIPDPDLIVVPGGIGARALLDDEPGQRVVEHLDQRIITAAGVSSGIDTALRLAELMTDRTTAQAMQLMIEYDPQPPFNAGNPAAAGPGVLDRVIELAQFKK